MLLVALLLSKFWSQIPRFQFHRPITIDSFNWSLNRDCTCIDLTATRTRWPFAVIGWMIFRRLEITPIQIWATIRWPFWYPATPRGIRWEAACPPFTRNSSWKNSPTTSVISFLFILSLSVSISKLLENANRGYPRYSVTFLIFQMLLSVELVKHVELNYA